MQLHSSTSDPALTAFDFVGGQCFAPASGEGPAGELPRSTAPGGSFGDLLSSIGDIPSAEAGPSRVGDRASWPVETPADDAEDVANPSVAGAAAVIPTSTNLVLPSPTPAAERTPVGVILPSAEESARYAGPERPAVTLPFPRQSSSGDLLVNRGDGQIAAPTNATGNALPTQGTGPEVDGAMSQPVRRSSTRFDRLPLRVIPADQANSQDSPVPGRTIAPARDGESAVGHGPVVAAPSRVWTFFPTAKHFRKSAAERAAEVDPAQPGALPMGGAGATTRPSAIGAVAAIPPTAVGEGRTSPPIGEVNRTTGSRGAIHDARQPLATTPAASVESAVPSITGHTRSAGQDPAVVHSSESGADNSETPASTPDARAIEHQPTDLRPLPAPIPEPSAQLAATVDARTLPIGVGQSMSAGGRAPTPESTVPVIGSESDAAEGDGPTARVETRDGRSSTSGADIVGLPESPVEFEQSQFSMAHAVDPDRPPEVEGRIGPKDDLAPQGDVDPAETGSVQRAAAAAENPVREPAAMATNVVQQIGAAVEAWRDALQEQGTARFAAWLTPSDLGHVWVEVTRTAEGLTARLKASDDSVQSLLETQGPELRQALSDSGITVTELDLSGRAAGDFSSDRQQQPPEQHSHPEPAAEFHGAAAPRGRAPRRAAAIDVRA